jgi:hypothetical protein
MGVQIQKRFTNATANSELKFASLLVPVIGIVTSSNLNDIYVNLTNSIYIAGKEIEIYSYETNLISPTLLGVTVFYSEVIPTPQ